MNDGPAPVYADPTELAAHEFVIERSAQMVRRVAEATAELSVPPPTVTDLVEVLDQIAAVLGGVGDAVADGLEELAGIVRETRTETLS